MAGKDGGPAFPAKEEWNDRGVAAFNHYTGMSLRDYFAAKALTGILFDVQNPNAAQCAKMAYALADAMLEERKK